MDEMTDDGLVKQIRASVLRLASLPTRALEPVTESEDKTRDAVRQLARSQVSQLLRQLRAAYGLSYAQIQEQTGLTQQVLFDCEYRARRLTLDELRMLLNCYGISVNDLLGVDVD
jgi:hypothetical protein